MRRQIVALLLGGLLLGGLPATGAVEKASCAATNAKLDALGREVANDMRRIRRELIALRTEIEKPGLNEVVAGLGYICGLFGVAFFVAGRRKKE